MKSYRPEELFDDEGGSSASSRRLRRRGAPHGRQSPCQWRPVACAISLPISATMRSRCRRPARRCRGDAGHGPFLRDVMKRIGTANFRLFSPDESIQSLAGRVRGHRPRLDGRDPAVRRPSRAGRTRDGGAQRTPVPGMAGRLSADRPARVFLLLRGVHPHHRFDVQSARQMAEGLRHIPWRRPIASLNYLLSSHVWRQDHNGFSHQDPGFIDHVVNKKADVMRVYLPPDANCLLSVTDHCLRSRNYVNVIVAGKQPAPQWLTWIRRSSTATPGSASGNGRATTAAASRTSSWPAAAMCRRWRRWPRSISCASICRTESPRGQCRRPDDAAARRASIRTALPTATSMPSSRPTSRSSSPFTAIPG